MRATVITPSGERLEGVTGDLLTYYLGEAEVTPGYQIAEEPDDTAASFPRIFDGETYIDATPVEQATPVELVSEPAPAEVEQPPEGQVFQTDGTVRESDGTSPLPDASGQVVDAETGTPVDAPPA